MKSRVLIVDDDPVVLKLLQHSLPDGAISRLAKNSFTALQLMETAHPDVILLDVDMPSMTGLEFLEILRQDQRWDYVRVLIISGKKDEESRLKAYEYGADDFISKPFLPEEIKHKVAHWARFSRAIELDRLKTEFLSLVEDPDCSPFTSAITAAEVVRAVPDVEEFKEIIGAVETLERSSEQFLKYLDLLQEYFSWHTGKKSGGGIPFALDSLLSPMLGQWEAICLNRSVNFILDPISEDLIIRTESRSLKRVVRWIFHNAVRFASGQVRVHAEKEDDDILLDIYDDGPGFNPAILPYVFSGFHPGNKLNLKHGIGLHLSLAKEILNAQGGDLTIIAPGPDGTQVRLLLPL